MPRVIASRAELSKNATGTIRKRLRREQRPGAPSAPIAR
jgi:hypothetical protein